MLSSMTIKYDQPDQRDQTDQTDQLLVEGCCSLENCQDMISLYKSYSQDDCNFQLTKLANFRMTRENISDMDSQKKNIIFLSHDDLLR